MALGCPACLMLLGDGEKPAPLPASSLPAPAHVETLLVVGCLVAATLVMKHVFKGSPGREVGRNPGIKPFRIAGVFDGRSGW
jgi:hypothetical protein